MNVVWYNKYGIKHDMENPGELAQYDIFVKEDKEENKTDED